nr:MAG TPA: hypothetical protein [Caudoviricetes sp.]DAX56764.1 MAG TPA: hypothetical protein [Caudoviricetes sp.]
MFTNQKKYLNTDYLILSCSKFKQSNNLNLPYLNATKLLKNKVFTLYFLYIYCSMGFL